MKSRIKSFFINNREIIAIVAVLSILRVLLIVGIFKRPYVFCNDQWFQFNIFYKEWIRLVRDCIDGSGLPFYSWNLFLGSDFFSSMSLYCTGNIFLPMHILLQSHLDISFVLEMELCTLIGAVCFNQFLTAEEISSKNTRILLSVIYAFGGANIIYLGNYMFSRFIAILPLLFLGVANYFKNRKRMIFILASLLLFLQNFYFMFPTLLFLLMYCIYKELDHGRNIKTIFQDFIQLLIGLILSFSLGAFILLPGILALLNNPRLGTANNELFWQANVYYGLITSLTSLNPVYVIPNIFETAHDAHDNGYNLLIGILPLLFAVRFLTSKNNQKSLVFFLVLLIFVLFPQASRIMHGLSVPSLRPTFLFYFIILFFSAKGTELSGKNDGKIIAIYYVIVLLCLILEFFQNYIEIPKHNIHLCLLISSCLFSFIIFFIYQKNRKAAYLLSILFVWASGVFYMVYGSKDSVPDQKIIDPEQVAYQQYIDSDKAFRYYFDYRHYIPGVDLNQNQPVNYGFMSSSGYISTIDSTTGRFTDLVAEKHGLDWCLDISDPFALTALGTKYYIVANEEELPKELRFEYAYNYDNYPVYENLDFQGFGYTATSIRLFDDYENPESLLTTVYIDESSEFASFSSVDNLNCNPFIITERGNNYFHGTVDSDSNNVLFIPLPKNNGWKILIDGAEVRTISVNGGFIGLSIAEGNHYIEGYFVPYGLKEGMVLSVLALIATIWVVVKENQRTTDSLFKHIEDKDFPI